MVSVVLSHLLHLGPENVLSVKQVLGVDVEIVQKGSVFH